MREKCSLDLFAFVPMVVGIGKARPVFSIQISGILRAYCGHIWACNTGQCRSLADTRGYFQNVEVKAFEASFLGAGDENLTRVLSLRSRVQQRKSCYVLPDRRLVIRSNSGGFSSTGILRAYRWQLRTGFEHHWVRSLTVSAGSRRASDTRRHTTTRSIDRTDLNRARAKLTLLETPDALSCSLTTSRLSFTGQRCAVDAVLQPNLLT